MVLSQVDIGRAELDPSYRLLVEPGPGIAGEGPYRTSGLVAPAAEFFPSGGRLGLMVGCTVFGTGLLAIGIGSLAAVLALASSGVVYVLGLLSFGGMVAAGIGAWAAGIRELVRYRSAARRRLGVFLSRDALLVCEDERYSLVPWSSVERASHYSPSEEPTDYLLLSYRDEGRPGTLRIRVPWRKGKVLRRIRCRIKPAG